MAKRVKTKKGSIGKKALAAILAASMVLSSSAFNVLAAEAINPVSEAVPAAEFSWGEANNLLIDGGNKSVTVPYKGELRGSVTDGLIDRMTIKSNDTAKPAEDEVDLKLYVGKATEEFSTAKSKDEENRKSTAWGTWRVYAETADGSHHTDYITVNVVQSNGILKIEPQGGKQYEVGDKPVDTDKATPEETDYNIKIYEGEEAVSKNLYRKDPGNARFSYYLNGDEMQSGDLVKGPECEVVVKAKGNAGFLAPDRFADPEIRDAIVRIIDTELASATDVVNPRFVGYEDIDEDEVPEFELNADGSPVEPSVTIIRKHAANDTYAMTKRYLNDPTKKTYELQPGRDYEVEYYHNEDLWKDGDKNKQPYAWITYIPGGILGEDEAEALNKDTSIRIMPFSIVGTDIGDVEIISKLQESFTYDGKDQYPGMESITIKAKNGDKLTLIEGEDYEVKLDPAHAKEPYTDNNDMRNVGKKTYQIVGIGKYAGEKFRCSDPDDKEDFTYEIKPAVMNSSNVEVVVSDIIERGGTYNWYDVIKNVYDILPVEKVELTSPEDYTVSFEGKSTPSTDAGTHTATITATGTKGSNFKSGSVNVTYRVEKHETLQMRVDRVIGTMDIVYDGTNRLETYFVDQVANLLKGRQNWEEGKDYQIVTRKAEWRDVGTYKLELRGKNVLKDEIAYVTAIIRPKYLNQPKGYHGTKSIVNTPDITIDAVTAKHQNNKKSTDVVVQVLDRGFPLENGKDYSYTVEDGKVIITGKGNYTTDLRYYPVDDYDDADIKVTNNSPQSHTQDIGTIAKMHLGAAGIEGNVKGTYTIKAEGETVEVNAHNISLIDKNDSPEYDLIHGEDFEIVGYVQDGKFNRNCVKEPGTAYVVVEGINDFTGRIMLPFTVHSTESAEEISVAAIDPIALKENGLTVKDIYAKIKVTYKDRTPEVLVAEEQYGLEILDADGNVKASGSYDKESGEWMWSPVDPNTVIIDTTGTYTVKVIPADTRLENDITVNFEVVGLDISGTAKVSDISPVTYTGDDLKPAVTVTLGGKTLVEGTDYELKYDAKNVGKGYVTVTFKGNYSGTKTVYFDVVKADGSAAVDAEQQADFEKGVPTGTTDKLHLVASIGDKQIKDESLAYKLVSDKPEVVEISEDGKTMTYKAVGTATITATLTSDNLNLAAETITATVKVVKAKALPVVHLTAKHYSTAKKTIGFTTNTVKGATKWEAQYSLNNLTKTTKGAKKVPYGAANKLSHKTIKVNKSKKPYYIRVRAYVNGSWTKWSEVEKITSR